MFAVECSWIWNLRAACHKHMRINYIYKYIYQTAGTNGVGEFGYGIMIRYQMDIYVKRKLFENIHSFFSSSQGNII